MTPAHKLEAVAICRAEPGVFLCGAIAPWSSRMRPNLLNTAERPHMFINELKLYVKYLAREIDEVREAMTVKQQRYIETFRSNLLNGIHYYEELLPILQQQAQDRVHRFKSDGFFIEVTA
jgi:hypothetical protein